MGQVYEDLYQHLISEGIDDSMATSVVNNMYDKEQYHNVEQLDEAAFRAASMIGRVAAKMMGFGKVSARAARGAGAQTLRTLNRRGSEAFQRGVRRRNWTPDRALPSGTSAGVRQRTLASLTKGSTASKSGGLVTTGRGGTLVAPGKGGPLASGGTTAGLGSVPKIEKVKVRDLGPSPSSGGPTRYQGTTSGGQLPQGGGTSSRMGQGLEKAKLAAAGGTSSGPATPAKGGPTPKALPGAGQTASRRNVAAATAAAAAAGTTGTGVKTGTTSAIKLRQGLSDRVRRAKDALRNANLSKAKLSLAAGAGVAAGAAVSSLTGGGSNISDMSPGGDTPPTTPKDNTLADKKPPTPKLPDYKVNMKFKGNVFTDKPKTDEPKTEEPKSKDDATANVKAAYEKGKPFDIRDRDITARASYDPRLKSERERMKRIKAERKARKEKK
tara:strand:+ start:371 stop:1690 length:1320 start_codon:yes stop_codon:yes gene_type:complete